MVIASPLAPFVPELLRWRLAAATGVPVACDDACAFALRFAVAVFAGGGVTSTARLC